MEKLQILLWVLASVGFAAGIAALIFISIHHESDSPHDGHAGKQGGKGANGPSGDEIGTIKEFKIDGSLNDSLETKGFVVFVTEQVNSTSVRVSWYFAIDGQIGTVPARFPLSFTFPNPLPSSIFTPKTSNAGSAAITHEGDTEAITATLDENGITFNPISSGTNSDLTSNGLYMLLDL